MTREPASTRPDLYSRVTAQILEDLERGVRPWTRPWSSNPSAGPVSRPLRHNGEPYRGINVLLLWAEATARGFGAPTWLTFRQAVSFGGRVRKGEHGATVVYANRVSRTEQAEDGTEADHQFRFLKAYTVFNVDQVDGLPERFHAPAKPELGPQARVAHAEAFFASTGARVRHFGDSAFYSPTSDLVQLPKFSSFADPLSYYATLAHECVHWTGHATRLGRDFSAKRDETYAREELVAELGAAFLCADLGLALEPREDHAAYLASWLKVLGRETHFIFTAAAHAQRAADFLHGLQPDP